MTLRFYGGLFDKFETIDTIVCVRKTGDEVPQNEISFVIVLAKRA